MGCIKMHMELHMHDYAPNEREKNKNIVQIQLLGIIDDRKVKTIRVDDGMEEVERRSEGRGRNNGRK